MPGPYIHSQKFARIAEQHDHSNAHWVGASALEGMTPATLLSGNDDYGAAFVELVPANTGPFMVGNTMYDPGRVEIISTDQTGIWRIQFAFGVDAAEALANHDIGDHSDILIKLNTVAPQLIAPARFRTRRAKWGTDGLFCRAWSDGTNAKTIEMFVEIHEYPS